MPNRLISMPTFPHMHWALRPRDSDWSSLTSIWNVGSCLILNVQQRTCARRKMLQQLFWKSLKCGGHLFYRFKQVAKNLLTGSYLFHFIFCISSFILLFLLHSSVCAKTSHFSKAAFLNDSKKGFHIYSFLCVGMCLTLKVRISLISVHLPSHSHTYQETLTLPVCFLGFGRAAGQGTD